MKANKLKTIVEEAVTLDRRIAEDTERLKELKRQLVLEATSRSEEQQIIPDGGKSIAFADDDGCVVRVTFPKPMLKAAINGEGRTIEKIRGAAGSVFNRLFLQAPKYRLADNFREEAVSLLGKEARQLIKLCTTNSPARVSFETKQGQDISK